MPFTCSHNRHVMRLKLAQLSTILLFALVMGVFWGAISSLIAQRMYGVYLCSPRSRKVRCKQCEAAELIDDVHRSP